MFGIGRAIITVINVIMSDATLLLTVISSGIWIAYNPNIPHNLLLAGMLTSLVVGYVYERRRGRAVRIVVREVAPNSAKIVLQPKSGFSISIDKDANTLLVKNKLPTLFGFEQPYNTEETIVETPLD